MSEWDSSVRTEPRGPFCHRHGFYDCPVCKGENPVWEIPVVDGSTEIGTLRVPWDFDDTLILISRGPDEPALADVTTEKRETGGVGRNPRAVKLDHVSIRANPWLLAKLKLILGEE